MVGETDNRFLGQKRCEIEQCCTATVRSHADKSVPNLYRRTDYKLKIQQIIVS